MNTRKWCCIFTLSVGATLLHLVTTAAEAAEDWTKIFAGEVLVKAVENAEGIPGVRAVFGISASKERIWAVLLDYDNYPKIFKGVRKTHVLEQAESSAKVEFWIKAVIVKHHYILDRQYEVPGRRLTWKRIAGDLKRIEGSWEIRDTPRADVNLLMYKSYVKVGRWIPTRLVRRIAMGKARDMGKRLRNWIEGRPLED